MEKQKLTISVDAMGGDDAPQMVIQGCALALESYPDVKFILFGDEAQVAPLLDSYPALKAKSEIRHTDQAIANDEKPSMALRHGKKSSMRMAIDCVADGDADCVISAGNTGALMAMALFGLKPLPGIHRPAIASYFPTQKKRAIMLDLGANIKCDAETLFQFAVLGAVFARAVLGRDNPTIGLLNVGEEEAKGNEQVKEAAALMHERTLPGQFHGFIEGDDITRGTVDVIVTDGFTGNIVLKAVEGTGRLVAGFLKDAYRSSLMSRLGYLFSIPAMRKLRKQLDPASYNGGMFLGLRGPCVKSHGGTDAKGFANALGIAIELVAQDFNSRLSKQIERLAAEQAEHEDGAKHEAPASDEKENTPAVKS